MNHSKIDTVEAIAQKISTEIERRERQNNTIQALIAKRQEVLIAMCSLAELESQEADFSVTIESLTKFNQALVDYTALGHFEVYERITAGKERRNNVKQIANSIYPAISKTTQQFVEFNDKYDGSDDQESLQNLYKDLSIIGEAMADRADLEDQLLGKMSGKNVPPNTLN